MPDVVDALARLQDAALKLTGVRDDLATLSKDCEGAPPEVLTELEAVSQHVHRSIVLVAEMTEGFTALKG